LLLYELMSNWLIYELVLIAILFVYVTLFTVWMVKRRTVIRRPSEMFWFMICYFRFFILLPLRLATRYRHKNVSVWVAICEIGLASVSRKRLPASWAFMQARLGDVLVIASAKNLQKDQNAQMVRAISCYNAALEEYGSEADAIRWAEVQLNKGIALMSLPEIQEGTNGEETLQEAIACLDSALLKYRQKAAPKDEARILAIEVQKILALWLLANLQEGTEQEKGLQDANACLNNNFFERCLKDAPKSWALAQLFRGGILSDLAKHQKGAVREETLQLAMDCYDNALLEYHHKVAPDEWAAVQFLKGNTLQSLSESQEDDTRKKSLEEAVACYGSASSEWRHQVDPKAWASIQFKIGAAHDDLATLQEGTEREKTLRKVIVYYDNALQEWRHEVAIDVWAWIQKYKGAAWQHLATLQEGAERAEMLQTAITCYEASLTVYKREILPGEHFRIAQSAGMLLFEEGEWEKAVNILTSALDTLDDLFALEVTVLGRQATLTEGKELISHLAYAYTRIGQIDTAAKVLERGRARITGEAITRQEAQIIQVERLDPDLLVEFRRLSNQLFTASRLSSTRGEPSALMAATGANKGLDAAQKTANRVTVEKESTLMAVLQAQRAIYEEARKARENYDMLVARIRESIPDFLRQDDVLKLAADILTPNERLAYIASSKAGAVAILVGNSAHNTSRSLKDCWDEQLTSSQVSAQVTQLLAAQADEVDDERLQQALSISMQQLGVSNGVLTQVAGYCRAENIRHLVIVPCGLLGLLPLHAALVPAATTNGETEPLLDVVQISYAPSARTWAICRRRTVSRAIEIPHALIVGNPQPQDSDVKKLPGASDEAWAINELITQRANGKAYIFLEEDATLPAVMETLKTGESTLTHIHFACHGKAELTDPDNSGLLLAFGARLKMQGLVKPEIVHFEQLRLASLSACQTASLDIELPDEVIGLPAAWLQAGAQGVLASFWLINDNITRAFMTRFYELHLRDQLGPVEALWLAQRWLRRMPTWRADCQSAGAMHTAKGPEADELVHELEVIHGESGPQDSATKIRKGQGFWEDARHWAAFVIYGA
jgi:CHAT domain-containing protein